MGYILFITICVGSFILFKLAELKDNKLFLVLGVVALSLGAGLRNDNVGLDTYQYISAFKTNFSVIWLFKETGFREISRLLMNAFSGNTTCLLLLYAAVTNALILYRLWDFRKDCSYSYMAFLYITLHYMNTLNIMRQYIAIAIVFFATRFLEKKVILNFGWQCFWHQYFIPRPCWDCSSFLSTIGRLPLTSKKNGCYFHYLLPFQLFL